MQDLQTLFTLLIIAALFYLVVNALMTGSVWVKGGRTGFINFKQLAHKRSRENEPLSYWGYIIFYVFALLWLIYLMLT